MSAVANGHCIELMVDGTEFQNRVKVVYYIDELMWIGLTPFNLIGDFCDDDAETLLKFCAEHPEYHIVSCDGERVYNRYVAELRSFYLAKGERNPYLVHNPWVNPHLPVIDWDVFEHLPSDPVAELERARGDDWWAALPPFTFLETKEQTPDGKKPVFIRCRFAPKK